MPAFPRLAIGVFSLAFVGVGLAWWIAPELAGALFRMHLLSGAGLSTQIADLASFFMTLGVLMLSGLLRGNGTWWYAAISLLAIAVVGRFLAWSVHGAELPVDMIAVEVGMISLLSLNVRHLAAQPASTSNGTT